MVLVLSDPLLHNSHQRRVGAGAYEYCCEWYYIYTVIRMHKCILFELYLLKVIMYCTALAARTSTRAVRGYMRRYM